MLRQPFVLMAFAVVSLGAGPRESSLVAAVKAGDATAVQSLLRQGVDVNAPGIDGTTPLHWAVYRDDLALLDRLLRAGADVRAVNRYGVSPLALACMDGSSAAVERLLTAGADANATLSGGESVLMIAARTGKSEAVRHLLKYGANVNARESTRGQTALLFAAVEGHAAVIRALLEAGADIHAVSHGPAVPEATLGDTRSTRGHAVRKVTRIDAFTPLLFAVRNGHQEATRALLDGGADANETIPGNGMSALVLAIANAHYELAALLLDAGADRNAAAQGWSPLHQIVRTRTLPINQFAHPIPTGRLSALDLAKKLLEMGANIEAVTTCPEPCQKDGGYKPFYMDGYRGGFGLGATPFLTAAKGADAEMMRFLAAHGANPHAKNVNGTTALMACAGVEMFNKDEDSGTNAEGLECLKVAIALGGNVNEANSQRETALHGAIHRGSNPIVQLLADHGAQLDPKNKAGHTPLDLAVKVGVGIAGLALRPEQAELLAKLMKARGIEADTRVDESRYYFQEKGREFK